MTISLYATNMMSSTSHLLFSPVFHKFPNLKVALSEGNIGWVPYMLERIDAVWERHRHYQNVVQDVCRRRCGSGTCTAASSTTTSG